MMGRLKSDQGQLFYEFCLGDAVPEDHLVRKIDTALDLSWLRGELAPHYSSMGRPSIDPELMIRMLIVGYVFAIRSERLICREVQVNLAYRWFCKLGIEDAVPDHSAFSRARNERFREGDVFRRVFERVVEACIAADLVGGEGFAVDASLIQADANKQRSIAGQDWRRDRDPARSSRAVKEYLATLDDTAWGAASDVVPKFISPSDPAAQWTGAHKGPAFFAYSDNYLIDVKFGVIVDVEASRSIRQAEVGAAKTMIERTEERFGLKPERLVGDTAYGAAPMLNWLVEEKGIAPHIPVFDKSKRDDGTFSRSDFRYDPTSDVYHCRAESGLGRAAPCTRARRSCIAPVSSTYTGQYVKWATFDSVRKAWLEAGLIEHKPGYPGALAFGNPGPTAGKLTRYRATPKLLEIAEAHGITPANVLEHFRIEFVMPSELIRLTKPSKATPDTSKVAKLRSDVAELNAFFAKQTLTPLTIKHLGWIRMFHGYTEGFRWDKGGRLYSQPQGPACYQNQSEAARLRMRINDERVIEIDFSSSYLTIFYSLCDEQLDNTQDAYAGILGPTALDRHVAKFWINASFGNSRLLTKWTKDLLDDLQDQLTKKGISGFDKELYPMRTIKEKVLERHPLLTRWGGKLKGRVRGYGDLMYAESEVVIGAMQTLMRDYQVPSLPVHDSLIVPASKFHVAKGVLVDQFRKQTGVTPKLDPEDDPEDF